MAMVSNDYRSTSSYSYQPSYTYVPTPSMTKGQGALIFGSLGLFVGLVAAALLWALFWTGHLVLGLSFGTATSSTWGWWIGWPAVPATLGVIGGVIFGD